MIIMDIKLDNFLAFRDFSMYYPKRIVKSYIFSFLKKNIENGKNYISCINANDFLKRNTDSLKQAVENDLFSTAPDVNLLFKIKDI